MIYAQRAVVLLAMLYCFALISSSWAQPSTIRTEGGFSQQERKWAVQWINKKLTLFMEDGLIERIKCSENDSSYEVFVSSAWDFLTVEEKMTFLANYSRARQITQHSPFLVVKSNDGGETVAEVNRRGIFLFSGEGEYFSPSAY